MLKEDFVFKPKIIIEEIKKILPKRELIIITKRYGLSPKYSFQSTLSLLGQEFNLTRERIRQIELKALHKLKDISYSHPLLNKLLEKFTLKLKKYHNILPKFVFLSLISGYKNLNDILSKDIFQIDLNYRINNFLIEKIFNSYFSISDDDENFYSFITCKNKSNLHTKLKSTLQKIYIYLYKKRQAIKQEELLTIENSIPISIYHIIGHKKIGKNPFDMWGLKEWEIISPKKIPKKIELILDYYKKPLHFTEITYLINKHFNQKQIRVGSVHNELIKNKNFILIGRGIYALKKWGYKEGTVKNIIYDILKDNPGLKKDKIIKKVLKTRLVKVQTIILALSDKKLFKKDKQKRFYLCN